MKECTERLIKVGFSRDPKVIFDEVEKVSYKMVQEGWHLKDTCIEENLASIHLFYERDLKEK